MIDTLESELKRLGATRVKRTKLRGCTLLVVELGGNVYLISLNDHGLTDNYVGKIVPSTKVFNWNCTEVEYSPFGLYVLASDEVEFINKVIKKLQLIMNV
ncbi:MAG: hypothetical protein QW596_01365 [Sulfolobales archaeon]